MKELTIKDLQKKVVRVFKNRTLENVKTEENDWTITKYYQFDNCDTLVLHYAKRFTCHLAMYHFIASNWKESTYYIDYEKGLYKKVA